ncbi:hypothetical protein CMT45_00920 [Elizabethkingia anophelis]|nr:hypothetical protein [Elizabethkingia anophelis]
METPKEQAIKAAYGEHWAGLSNEKQKYALENEGWIKVTPSQYQMDMFSRLKLNKNTHSVRPKSLSGIRNNNSWIKLNKESDLPKEKGDYWVIWNGKIIVQHWLSNNPDNPYNEMVQNNQIFSWMKAVTHYQPIETPKPPIF